MLLATLFLFFLILLRPPRPTLFPYTTLFRSHTLRFDDPHRRHPVALSDPVDVLHAGDDLPEDGVVTVEVGRGARSEEHTSELQSHSDLVCRLLLEKKKKDRKENYT